MTAIREDDCSVALINTFYVTGCHLSCDLMRQGMAPAIGRI